MQLTIAEKKVIKFVREIKNNYRYGDVIVKIHEGTITRIDTTIKEDVSILDNNFKESKI